MDLKPCPFCGEDRRLDRRTCGPSEPGLVIVVHPFIGYVRCATCRLDGPTAVPKGDEELTEAHVADAWNRRPSSVGVAALVEQADRLGAGYVLTHYERDGVSCAIITVTVPDLVASIREVLDASDAEVQR